MQCISNKSYANIVPRAIAYLIDIICVTVISGIIFGTIKGLNIETLNKGVLFNYSIIAICTYLVKKLYFICMTASTGQTLGKMCFRIKVINNDGSKVSFWNIVYRETIARYLTEVVLCLGYLGVLTSEQKKGLHDWLCDTCVVYDEYINNERVYYIPPKNVPNMQPGYNMQQSVMPMGYSPNNISQPMPDTMDEQKILAESKESFTQSDINSLVEGANESQELIDAVQEDVTEPEEIGEVIHEGESELQEIENAVQEDINVSQETEEVTQEDVNELQEMEEEVPEDANEIQEIEDVQIQEEIILHESEADVEDQNDDVEFEYEEDGDMLYETTELDEMIKNLSEDN